MSEGKALASCRWDLENSRDRKSPTGCGNVQRGWEGGVLYRSPSKEGFPNIQPKYSKPKLVAIVPHFTICHYELNIWVQSTLFADFLSCLSMVSPASDQANIKILRYPFW